MPCAGSSNAEVQCGQRTAARGSSVQQNGQGLVVGAASSFLRPTANRRLMARIRQKRIRAMMKKLTTADKNADANPAISAQE